MFQFIYFVNIHIFRNWDSSFVISLTNILADGKIGGEVTKEIIDKMRNESIESHKFYVKKALKEGKTPYKGWEEDYSELKKEHEKPEITPKATEGEGTPSEVRKPGVPEEKIKPEDKTKAVTDLVKQREAEYEEVRKIKDLDERIKKATEVEEKYKEKIAAQKAEGVYTGMDTTGPEIRTEAKKEIKGKAEKPVEPEVKVSVKVVEYPVEKIKVEPEKFQQRKEEYVEEHVKNIMDNWDNVSVQARIEIIDFDKNGTDEVIVETRDQNLYFSLLDGGTLFEHDLRAANFNIHDTMARREEGYHKKLLDIASQKSGKKKGSEPASIHDLVAAKEKDLEKKLHYDNFLPRSMRLRILPPDTEVDDLCSSPRLLGKKTD